MIEIQVYGAEQLCASCVNAPSSRETASWLGAALSRVYANDAFLVRYIDIYSPKTQKEQEFSQRVIEEDLWYPVVVIEGNIVTEGSPNLKMIYQYLDQVGISRV